MSLEVDQEILEDFLVEAGEILEQLSEQLVDLEQRPDDSDLLNAIFRGFHTVKGGAGFLQLDPMVDCCHNAENLFDLLRNGDIKVTSSGGDLRFNDHQGMVTIDMIGGSIILTDVTGSVCRQRKPLRLGRTSPG